MYKKYTAVVLAVLVLAAEANVVNKPAPVVLGGQLDGKREASGWGLTADVNDYVDNTIHMIIPLIQIFGLDPMPLPEVVEGFSVRPLLITYSAWLKIHQGELVGLSKVQRSGDQMVHYFNKMLRVRVQLQFSDLEFNYNYLVQVMNIGPTGGIVATLDSYQVIVDVLIDFNNDEVQLQEFAIGEIGRLRVRFRGNLLTDWLVNPVIGVFVTIFNNTIIKVVELNIRNVVNYGISHLNFAIKQIFEVIESYNP